MWNVSGPALEVEGRGRFDVGALIVRQIALSHWPRRNHCINLRHQADRLRQGDDDLLIVQQFIQGEFAPLTIFELLVQDLIAAPLELPDFRKFLGDLTHVPRGFVLCSQGA